MEVSKIVNDTIEMKLLLNTFQELLEITFGKQNPHETSFFLKTNVKTEL